MTDESAQRLTELQYVNRALEFAAAVQSDPAAPIGRNAAVQEQMRRIVAFDTPEQIGEEMSKVVNGFLFLTTALIGQLAETTKTTPDQVIEVFRRQTQENIRNVGRS